MVIHLSYILINILCILYTNSQIVIKDAGTARIQPTDIGMIFYLTLENICPSDMYISVRGVKCCEVNSVNGAKDCHSSKLVGGDPGLLCAGKTKNVSLIYPNLYLYGRQGVCTVLVVYKIGSVTEHFFHKIPYNTKGAFQDLSVERCPCYTSDLDPFRNCSPVDCPIKYSGNKNFFNGLTKYCEVVPFCQSAHGSGMVEEMYDILHNRCMNVRCSVTAEDLTVIEERKIPNTPLPYIFGNMICHHGCIDKKTGECICNNKWLSTVSNGSEFSPSLISTHMCNIRTGSWTELNKDKLLLTILVMVIMTSLCIVKLFFLVCILHFCYKWARSKAKGDCESMSQFGFGKNYGAVRSRPCSRCSSSSSMKSKKTSNEFSNKCEGGSICEKIHRGRNISCKSQGAQARTRLSDKCFQFEIARRTSCPNMGVMTAVDCSCKAHSSPQARAKSVQTDPSKSRIQTAESLESILSDDSDQSETSSSICSCLSTSDDINIYQNDDNAYFASTYATGFYSSNNQTKETTSQATETSNTSSFSINMEYDTEDLELECSSSSER